MRKKNVLLVLLVVAAGAFANLVGAGEAQAFPGNAAAINMTLNPGAVPVNGTGMVTVSYFCNGSGCTTPGGAATLTLTPTGVWTKASTCSAPAATGPNPVVQGVPAFDCPLQSSAVTSGINSNRLTIPGPEPATQGLHVFQAVFQATGTPPGKSINVCYSASTTPQPADGSGTGLCQSVLVTKDSPPQVRVKALTQSTIPAGGRVVLGAQVLDDQQQPIAGLPVTFKAAATNLGVVGCATNADFSAGNVQFKPIFTGTDAAAAVPGALAPNTPSPLPAGNVQTVSASQGSTSPIGGPLPGTTAQNTPNGYQCFAGNAAALAASPVASATTPKGLLPSQHEVSVLADAEGWAVATFLSLPNAEPGAAAKVIAEVYQGVSDKPVASADSPLIQFGTGVKNSGLTLRANPLTIAGTNPVANATELVACATGALVNGSAAPTVAGPGSEVNFSVLSRTPENIDAAFAQSDGKGKANLTVQAASDGCARAHLISSGAGSVTVVASLVGSQSANGTASVTVPVGSVLAEAGQPGFFADAPNGSRAVCPNVGVWALLYWLGADTPIETAMKSCLNSGKFWVRRGATWLAAKSGDTLSSDKFTVGQGEAVLVYGTK